MVGQMCLLDHGRKCIRRAATHVGCVCVCVCADLLGNLRKSLVEQISTRTMNRIQVMDTCTSNSENSFKTCM